MAYGIQNLRRSAVFDELTPGGPAYSDQPSQDQSYEPQDTRMLGPDGVPLSSQTEEPTSNGLAKLADLSVDPNKGTEQERLQEYLDTIQGAYTPNYKSRDRNDNLLDNFPTRGQPTKMDRFTAAMLSVGQKDAADITEKTLQAPYYRDRADWIAKTEPFYKAASLENVDNTNNRQVVGTAANTFTQGEKTAQAQRAADQRFEGVNQRNAINEFKARNPNWIFDTKGPTIKAFNPANPTQTRDLGPSGHLSDAEKIAMEGTVDKEVAGIRANATTNAAQIRANASGTTGTGSGQYYVDSKGQNFKMVSGRAVDVNGNPVDVSEPFEKIRTDRESVDTPNSQATDLRNRMTNVYNRTAGGKKWLIPQNNGSYTTKERPSPTTMFGGDNSAEVNDYDATMKAIWPDWTPNGFTGPTPIPNHQGPAASPSALPNHQGGTGTPTPLGGGPPIKNGPGDGTLRARAADELRRRGKVVSQETIDQVIAKGLVK